VQTSLEKMSYGDNESACFPSITLASTAEKQARRRREEDG
jgi:hypothetical protein